MRRQSVKIIQTSQSQKRNEEQTIKKTFKKMFSNITANTFVQLFTGQSKCLPKVLKKFNRTLYRSAGCLGKINVANDDKYVVLNCDESKSLKYPIVWLRDNCQCNECFHRGSMSRIIDWSKFDVNVKIDSIWVSCLFNLCQTRPCPSRFHISFHSNR